ncbi:MAG: flagellin [Candidatus Scalindua sp.]|jgi:flagellin|nr:flagellin [Candidatus Scalindua sp.]MBT6226307.1 flagellin [Candidatus Scalindua sp.]MBT7213270.1 flagellin [Candidatus Scalindua sp.]MBT7592522.1 flagellin [Candidatus Scalindua sp.]
MGLRIQSNIAAFNSHRNLQIADAGLSKSLEKLSSGFRINKASDDAAGLAVSMRFKSQIKSLQQAGRNASEANSLLQVAEGAADQITNILQRMKELSTQAASSNTGQTDRANISSEVNNLESEISRIASSTKYSGSSLIDGNFGALGVSSGAGGHGSLTSANGVTNVDVSNAAAGTEYSISVATAGNNTMTISDGTTSQSVSLGAAQTGMNTSTLDFSNLGIKVTVNSAYTADGMSDGVLSTMTTADSTSSSFQVGYENNANNKISFSLANLTAGAAGLNADVDVSTQSGAQTALASIDTAIDTLANARAVIGRTQNQFGFASANLASTVENLSAANSVIKDADMAFETVDFTKNQILLQAGTSMLAQANQSPQSVLSLLG